MKYKLFLLIPFLLFSCNSNNNEITNKDTNSLDTNNNQENIIELHKFTYTCNKVEIMEYNSTFKLAPFLFDGVERKDYEIKYCFTNKNQNIATISSDGIITTSAYNPNNNLGNINEYLELVVSSLNAENDIRLHIAVVNLVKDVSFKQIREGKNYYFYTSDGIIENLILNSKTSGNKLDWYATCNIRSLDLNDYFYTTISKSYDCIMLKDSSVTSHFRTIIKRDEIGSLSMKEVKNGTHVKFLVMFERLDEYGTTKEFNSIILEEKEIDESTCNITNYNSNIEIDKNSGRYNDTFNLTLTKNSKQNYNYVYVNSSTSSYLKYLSMSEDDTKIYCTNSFFAKEIIIYTQENVDNTSESLINSYIPGSGLDYSLVCDKKTLSKYLFNDDYKYFNVLDYNNLIPDIHIFKFGIVETTSSSNLSFSISLEKELVELK